MIEVTNNRVPILSGKQLIKLLVSHGFIDDRCSGSHHIMKKDRLTVSVPHKGKDLNRPMILKILKQAGLWT